MRKIVLTSMSTLAAVITLFGYRTSTPPASMSAATSVVAAADGSDASSSGTTATAPQASTGSSAASTVTGEAVQTRWGPVQVQITVTDGRLTSATAVQQPSGNRRDLEINARALPVLSAEAVEAQSADIDAVSGATVTSEGYVGSLQSALDQAGL